MALTALATAKIMFGLGILVLIGALIIATGKQTVAGYNIRDNFITPFASQPQQIKGGSYGIGIVAILLGGLGIVGSSWMLWQREKPAKVEKNGTTNGRANTAPVATTQYMNG